MPGMVIDWDNDGGIIHPARAALLVAPFPSVEAARDAVCGMIVAAGMTEVGGLSHRPDM